VVNLFTEDHAALTGARKVIIEEALKPERSYNGNLNYVHKIQTTTALINLDATAFYAYFTNKINGDFDTHPDQIIYRNLNGHAISRGISFNADINFRSPLKALLGVTYMDVYQMEARADGTLERKVQLHAPRWTGNFVVSYTLPHQYMIDLTGRVNGPMRLPILPNDYRPEYSPWYCIANLQLTRKWSKGIEIYGGIKNLLNFIPHDPILRAHDPFDKQAANPVENPQGYTFDPSYNYASMQGMRFFLGFRYSIL
jgi:outer membrane receptor for ferrienterochelin and colicins